MIGGGHAIGAQQLNRHIGYGIARFRREHLSGDRVGRRGPASPGDAEITGRSTTGAVAAGNIGQAAGGSGIIRRAVKGVLAFTVAQRAGLVLRTGDDTLVAAIDLPIAGVAADASHASKPEPGLTITIKLAVSAVRLLDNAFAVVRAIFLGGICCVFAAKTIRVVGVVSGTIASAVRSGLAVYGRVRRHAFIGNAAGAPHLVKAVAAIIRRVGVWIFRHTSAAEAIAGLIAAGTHVEPDRAASRAARIGGAAYSVEGAKVGFALAVKGAGPAGVHATDAIAVASLVGTIQATQILRLARIGGTVAAAALAVDGAVGAGAVSLRGRRRTRSVAVVIARTRAAN